MCASRYGHREIAQLLVDLGADVNTQQKVGSFQETLQVFLLWTTGSLLALHKKVHVCMCVCVQSVLWLRATMDEWLDSLSVKLTTRVRIPLNVLFFFLFFFFLLFFSSPLFLFILSLLVWADLCTAELATWGVGPDVNTIIIVQQEHYNIKSYV